MRRTVEVVLVAGLLCFVFYLAYGVIQHGRIDKTGFCIGQVSMILRIEQPSRLDSRSLENVLLKYPGARGCHSDGWGHPILVTRSESKSGPVYTVISYGRDGKPGPGRIPGQSHDPDLDWVKLGDRYLPE